MRPLKNLCEIAVIGGGLSGLAAARHAARLGRLVTLFEGSGLFGGQVATVGEVEGLDVPGRFSGQDLAIPLLEAARNAQVRVVETPVAAIGNDGQLTIADLDGQTYRPEAIIVASGLSPRKLGVPGEDAFYGSGVSHCATCDGGFFRGRDVAVIGGGDGAVHEALVLTATSRQVIMICRGKMRARRDAIDRLAARENVRFVWDSEVSEIVGNGTVSGLRLRNVRNGGASEIDCAGVFPFVGGVPNTGFLPPALRNAGGYVATGADLATADRRIFAAGAVRAGYGGALAQAMAEGIGAAQAASRFLTH
jgi:thioredoxin reductase (NADPH)